MESLDLHPEELFDKADAGLADEREHARLAAHLKACATCRVERQVRADFAAITTSAANVELLIATALRAPAESADHANLDELVARALQAQNEAAKPARRRRNLTPWLIAAALVSGMSFAAVAQFTGLLPRLLESRTEAPPEPVAPTPVPRANPVAFVVADEPAVFDEVTPPSPPPVVVAPPHRTLKPAIELPPAPEPAIAAPDAATLFSLAHAARIDGRRGDAVEQLRELVARFPNEPAGALAWAELGTLWLEGGEPARAVEAFDTYLASSHGLLREEVLTSRAQAFGALGHAAEERAAWERLLQEFPNGLTSARARVRVEALNSPP